jgi:hypothetical protein
MKIIIIAALALLQIFNSVAQLYVGNGATLTATNNASICLQNTDFIKQGTFNIGQSNVLFTGNTACKIASNTITEFYNLSSQTTDTLTLQSRINIANNLNINSIINTNNNAIKLLQENGAKIINENEQNRLIDLTQNNFGYAFMANYVGAPLSNNNLANLGVAITTAQVLEVLVLQRYIKPINNNGSSAGYINRYYRVSPQNNSNLNATAKFYYFDAELNGVDENTAVLWKSTDFGVTWQLINPDDRNTTNNYLEKNNINEFGWWGIGSPNGALPIVLNNINTQCLTNGTKLFWQVQTETNLHSYVIEHSANGTQWQAIATQTPTGNNSNYSFTHSNTGKNYYRVKIINNNGTFSYTSTQLANCAVNSVELMVFPNPANTFTNLNFNSLTNQALLVQIFNNAGQKVRQFNLQSSIGSNTIRLNLVGLAAGTYTLKVNGNNINQSKQIIIQ